MTELTAAGLAAMVDHTFLQSTGTRAEAESAAAEAARLGAYSVCVSPSMIPLPAPDTRGHRRVRFPVRQTPQQRQSGRGPRCGA